MRGKSFFVLFCALALFLTGGRICSGAGFALYEGSARGNALGGAVVGMADDPSAVFYNPAGITQLPGIQTMAGATFILPASDIVTTSGGARTRTESVDNVWFPPHLYLTGQVTDSLWLGFGSFSQFGLGTEFDQNWPGRYNSYKAFIESVTINPNVVYKVNNQLSVAAGLDIIYFDIELDRKIDPLGLNNPAFDVDRQLKGDAFGYGFNLAVHYKPLDWLSMGVSYRSQAKVDVEGTSDFTKPAALAASPALSRFFNDTDASGSIILPDMLFMGIAFKPIDRLSMEVGATWTRWSLYNTLSIDYEIDPMGSGRPAAYGSIKDWRDAWRFQIGAEYRLLDWLDLRGGYTYDETPDPNARVDYLVPANDRHLFALGSGAHWGNWTFDLSYTYLHIVERHVSARPADSVLESDFENGHAHLIGASVGYKF